MSSETNGIVRSIPLLFTQVAGEREKHLAMAIVGISSVIFVAAVPFVRMPLPHVSAFIPLYVSAFVICDGITAVLLFGQFRFSRSWALLVLAGSYLFTASITISYALMFPGLFSPTGLLSAGGQSTSAMYMFWHAGFPIAVICYAVFEDSGTRAIEQNGNPNDVTLATIAAVITAVLGISLLVTAGHDYLPVFIQGDHTTYLGHIVLLSVWILSLAALVVLWRRRPYTMIDLWLMVVMCSWLFDIALAAVLNGGRYDLGWYVGRIYGLSAASILLILLLIESGNHYSDLIDLHMRLGRANKFLEQQALRTAAELRRFRALLEAAPDAIILVNHHGHILLSNLQAERQFGYGHDELLGQVAQNIIFDGSTGRLMPELLRWGVGPMVRQVCPLVELSGQRKNGSVFPVEVIAGPLEGIDGAMVIVVMRDITSRKKLELELSQKMRELIRSNEELEQFAYVASHDLQEPLRMVSSYMKLLSRRYKGKLGSDADEFIGFAVDGASRMQQLIQGLLAYSRVNSTGRALCDTASEKALQQALTNLQGAISDSGALVTHDALPIVLADEVQLTQIFQNLIGNAIKYQYPGVPKVHVTAAMTDERKWMFSVQDNGMGIDSKYFETIFGMFQRLHKRDEFEGTGIGLAICKKIIERHGGSISVESQPGHGSNFCFALVSAG